MKKEQKTWKVQISLKILQRKRDFCTKMGKKTAGSAQKLNEQTRPERSQGIEEERAVRRRCMGR